MTSTVTNYSSIINVNYPIPGVDNDTQTFRDNFANIRNSLDTAANEITTLQSTTAKLNSNDNDFNYYELYRASLKGSGESSPTLRTISSSTVISFYQGSYQPISIASNVTVTVVDWPTANTKGAIQFEIYNNSNSNSNTVTFSAGSGNTLKVDNGITAAVTLTTTNYSNPVVYELWSRNAGSTVFLRKVGGPFT